MFYLLFYCLLHSSCSDALLPSVRNCNVNRIHLLPFMLITPYYTWIWQPVLFGSGGPAAVPQSAPSVQQSDDIDLCYLTRPGSQARSVYATAKRDRRNTKRSQLVCSVRLLAPTLSHGVTAQVWSLVTVPWIMEPLRWVAASGEGKTEDEWPNLLEMEGKVRKSFPSFWIGVF